MTSFWKSKEVYSRGQIIKYCKKCKDTSFELLENKKPTGRCCRCGSKFVSNK